MGGKKHEAVELKIELTHAYIAQVVLTCGNDGCLIIIIPVMTVRDPHSACDLSDSLRSKINHRMVTSE